MAVDPPFRIIRPTDPNARNHPALASGTCKPDNILPNLLHVSAYGAGTIRPAIGTTIAFYFSMNAIEKEKSS
jgi:hypothetical protein